MEELAWSSGGYWTFLGTLLAEMGDEGWELVGTTPTRYLWTSAAGHMNDERHTSEYLLIFKRPK